MKQKLFNVIVALHLVFLTMQGARTEKNLNITMGAVGEIIAFLIQLTGGGQ